MHERHYSIVPASSFSFFRCPLPQKSEEVRICDSDLEIEFHAFVYVFFKIFFFASAEQRCEIFFTSAKRRCVLGSMQKQS